MVGFRYKIPVQYLREGDTIVAVCPVLDVSAYGKTLQEAHANLRSAIDAFFQETAEHGTLDHVLQEHGWQRRDIQHQLRWSPPELISSDYEEATVPA